MTLKGALLTVVVILVVIVVLFSYAGPTFQAFADQFRTLLTF